MRYIAKSMRGRSIVGASVNDMRKYRLERNCPGVRTLRSLNTKSAVWDGKTSFHDLLGIWCLLREGVSIDPGLLLGLGLVTPLEVALLETPINTDGKVVRDTSGEVDDLLNTDISKGGSDDIRWETEKSLGDLVNARVFVVKSSDESNWFTAEVELVVDRSLGENGSLTLTQGVDDEASAVLLDEPGVHLTVNEEQELRRSGMGVRAVHSARCHLADCQGHPVGEERREVRDVGDGEVPAGVPCGPNSSIVIKQPIVVVLEDIEASDLSRCPLQIRHEIGCRGSVCGLGDGLESGSENERDSYGELHYA